MSLAEDIEPQPSSNYKKHNRHKWTSIDGTQRDIKDMTSEHIKNTILMLSGRDSIIGNMTKELYKRTLQ